MQGEQAAQWFRETFSKIRSEVQKAIVGQEDIVEGALCALAANQHVLLEGLPGLGKTLLVRSMAEALDVDFSRIQFTPDLMPADVTGTNVLSHGESGVRSFEFRRGPIFANLVLADEINRATPKTQSSMLEAMQERSVTVGGKRHALDEPFLVMATQNPIEQEGTYPLPEAQLDRFFMKLVVGYPNREELARIVLQTTGTEDARVQPVADKATAIQMREVVKQVPVAQSVLDFALSIVLATHGEAAEGCEAAKRYARYGSSPRGAQSLITAAKVYALVDGRYNVSKDDLKRAAKPVLRHRILLNFEAEADGVSSDRIVEDAIRHVEARDPDPIGV